MTIAAAALVLMIFTVGYNWRVVDSIQRRLHAICASYQFCELPITLKRIKTPFPAISVEANGSILERIHVFNVALDRIRRNELESISRHRVQATDDWTLSPAGEIKTLHEWKDDFLEVLGDYYPRVKTVILPWIGRRLDWSSLNDSSNLLTREYYRSTATDPLCNWIETPGTVNYAYDMITNWTCNRYANRTMNPVSITPLDLNAKPPYKDYYFPSSFPPHFHRETPFAVFRLHVIRHGIVNRVGDVFSRNLKIVPYGCFPILELNLPPAVEAIPLYKEVFVIAQHHGDETYHRISEVMPCIAVNVEFLLRNPSIKIFCLENQGLLVELLGVLGIDRHRIVTGWSRAEIVYLPRSSMCCMQSFFEPQILSLLFRDYTKRHLTPTVRLNRDRVVVIRRSHYRRFKDQDEIERSVEAAARSFNLSFTVFKDNPPPSLNETMVMFNTAVVVIGPHGAGLANVVFSEPGTFVIEGVCNLPHANLFFQRNSLVLGHRWHGVPAKDGCTHGVFGVVNIEPSLLKSVLLEYLNLIYPSS